MVFFQQFYLDREKDIVVQLFWEGSRLLYLIRTPNHHTGNLITNLARLVHLETSEDERGLKVIRGEVPGYVDGKNRLLYILRLGNTKVANIWPDGAIELKASIPAISKTLMSQTKDYRLGEEKTIVKTYIRQDCKFRTDLHTHMNGNLPPDVLIALGIIHQIRYPYYYIKKLELSCTTWQLAALEADRREAEVWVRKESSLTGRHLDRRIDDYTFINFADLILGNPECAGENIEKIRNSLTIPKDGQAVFEDLEKVYLYRYVFTRGLPSAHPFSGLNIEAVPDREIRDYARRMQEDRMDPRYRRNTLFQDLLLWIAREYQRHGILYAEISDTALLRQTEFPARLREIHEIMPAVTRETGVVLRFLAALRRIPLTIIRDQVTPGNYLAESLTCLRIIAADPYVAGSDIVGEEINDILELREVIRELTRIAGEHPGFVIRIHAGENDSLRDNVANSIRCVRESLAPGQAFPPMRLGHGLYTCDLNSARGHRLLEEIRRCGVTLEFQITSNVRLNNLSTLSRHPLRQYLKAGIRCVQGTDGGALYGTNSIQEELSLEKLLCLTHEELCAMCAAEDELLSGSMDCFERKTEAFREACPGDPEQYYRARLASPEAGTAPLPPAGGRLNTAEVLAHRMGSLPEDALPVVIAGGSFNSSRRRSALRPEDRELLDQLLNQADPRRIVFVLGHTLSAQEGYVARQAAGRFRVFAVVPAMITPAEKKRLEASGAELLPAAESSGMGLYKTFSDLIFRRGPSVLLAFDGNSAALNLIQEARNGRKKSRIFISPRSRLLNAKARVLEGYVRSLKEPGEIMTALAELARQAE